MALRASSDDLHPFTVAMRSDGIAEVRWLVPIEITGDLARAVTKRIAAIRGDSTVALLVDIDRTRGLDRESRQIFQNAGGFRAIALLVSSPVSRVIANLFIGLNKPATPIRLFTAEDDAIEWLKSFGA